MAVNSIGLVHSTKDSHTIIKTKHFPFLPLTLPRHFLVHFHLVLRSPYCYPDFAMVDLLALITANAVAIFIYVILLNVSD